jgi:hypothetical protein
MNTTSEPRRWRKELKRARPPMYRFIAVGYDFACWALGVWMVRDLGQMSIEFHLGPLWIEFGL